MYEKLARLLIICTMGSPLAGYSQTLDPNYIKARKIGMACFQKQDYECAKKQFNIALAFNKNDVEVNTYLKIINDIPKPKPITSNPKPEPKPVVPPITKPIAKKIPCPKCNGFGELYHSKTCETCKGSGSQKCLFSEYGWSQCNDYGNLECIICNGSGNCRGCKGTGRTSSGRDCYTCKGSTVCHNCRGITQKTCNFGAFIKCTQCKGEKITRTYHICSNCNGAKYIIK